MIRMSLKFEEYIVSESMRSVPTMQDVGFLIFSIRQFLSEETIVFQIVDGFNIENGDECDNAMDD